MKRYRLIKDLPTFKAGETFALLDSFETHGLYRESDGVMAYHQTTLYKFPNILMEWFEEIKPAEPLIKDKKVRKAVRAWAEANSLKWAAYSADGKFYDKTIVHVITFKTFTNRTDIPECKLLLITELCGEEEE